MFYVAEEKLYLVSTIVLNSIEFQLRSYPKRKKKENVLNVIPLE